MCCALSIKCARSAFSPNGAVRLSISHKPAGSASTHTNHTKNPPSTAPRLLPEPPTMTMTQMRKVKRSGW